jgi:RNA polymerase sigma-70 factor (ECF subfamily)
MKRERMNHSDKTQLGGANEAFPRTQWTKVAKGPTGEATEVIVQQYWKPVYCFIRRRWPGKSNEEAKDLTQGFFCDVVMGRHLLRRADRSKGRFRSFLLATLKTYVAEVHRAQTARKRMPAEGLIPLDGIDPASVPEPSDTATPEQAFIHAWASELLDDVLAEVQADCQRDGKGKHWEVFCRTVVAPTLTGAPAPPMSQLCQELGIESEATASNMNVTAKRRFKAALEGRARRFVGADDDVEQEIRDLMQILSQGSAGR